MAVTDEDHLADTDEYSLTDEFETLIGRTDEFLADSHAAVVDGGNEFDRQKVLKGMLLFSRAKRILFADGLTRIDADKAIEAHECIKALGPDNVPEPFVIDFFELTYLGHRLGTDDGSVVNMYAEQLLVFVGRLESLFDGARGAASRTGLQAGLETDSEE